MHGTISLQRIYRGMSGGSCLIMSKMLFQFCTAGNQSSFHVPLKLSAHNWACSWLCSLIMFAFYMFKFLLPSFTSPVHLAISQLNLLLDNVILVPIMLGLDLLFQTSKYNNLVNQELISLLKIKFCGQNGLRQTVLSTEATIEIIFIVISIG